MFVRVVEAEIMTVMLQTTVTMIVTMNIIAIAARILVEAAAPIGVWFWSLEAVRLILTSLASGFSLRLRFSIAS